jgi:hypothetical protein
MARSIKKNSSFFSLEITPHVVPIQDILLTYNNIFPILIILRSDLNMLTEHHYIDPFPLYKLLSEIWTTAHLCTSEDLKNPILGLQTIIHYPALNWLAVRKMDQ